MKATVDIIDELISGFNPVTDITEVIDNGLNNYTIAVCNTLNIRKGSIFTIDLVEYIAISVDTNLKTITFESLIVPTKGQTVQGTIPFFFHGTPISVGNELTKISNSVNKFPMIYLFELIKDKFNNDPELTIDRTSDIILFFLDEANFEDWDTDQHYSDAIVPMMNYADLFIKYLNSASIVGVIEDYELTYHAKFGLNIKTNSGHIQNLFPENISGVQLRVSLPILKANGCDC